MRSTQLLSEASVLVAGASCLWRTKFHMNRWRPFLDRFTPKDEEEHGGVILYRDGFSYVGMFEMPNKHPEPQAHFRIYCKDIPKVSGAKVFGYFHTHPGYGVEARTPSEHDLEQSTGYPGYIDFVWHPGSRLLTWYQNGKVLSVVNVEYDMRKLRRRRHE